MPWLLCRTRRPAIGPGISSRPDALPRRCPSGSLQPQRPRTGRGSRRRPTSCCGRCRTSTKSSNGLGSWCASAASSGERAIRRPPSATSPRPSRSRTGLAMSRLRLPAISSWVVSCGSNRARTWLARSTSWRATCSSRSARAGPWPTRMSAWVACSSSTSSTSDPPSCWRRPWPWLWPSATTRRVSGRSVSRPSPMSPWATSTVVTQSSARRMTRHGRAA